jgi:hypothetical protein
MDALMARDGARLVMLGTPHQGAYSMVENLLGKATRCAVWSARSSTTCSRCSTVAAFRPARAAAQAGLRR